MSGKSHANIKPHVFWSVQLSLSVISGFRREVDEKCAFLGYKLILEYPERSVRDYHYSLHNNTE
jgi:hypothetical protein